MFALARAIGHWLNNTPPAETFANMPANHRETMQDKDQLVVLRSSLIGGMQLALYQSLLSPMALAR